MSFRTASVYIWLVGLLACAELALQYRAHVRGWDTPLFHTTLASGVAVASDRPARFGPTQEFPFRSEIVAREVPEETSRLWVASASHAEDIYLTIDQTFPAQAGRLLNSDGGTGHLWQVLNASRAGNLISTNTADLSRLAPDWQPSVVVLYQMSMEIVNLSRTYLDHNRPTDEQAGDKEPAGEGPPEGAPVTAKHGSTVSQAAAETTAYTTLKANFTPWIASQRVLADQLNEAAEHDFERRIRRFLYVVRESGAVPMLCTFATSQGERDAERLPRDVRQFMLRYNQYLSPLGWTRTIARFNELIRGIAAEEGVALVDCEHAMTGDARYFRDYVHFTPAGHERMAELITEKLRDIEPVSPVAASGLGANE